MKNLTELVFILDRSGSMHGLEKDTIGGFNSMLAKQRKVKGDCLVSCVLFDNTSEVIFDREDINKIKEMSDEDYTPGGCTALIDALGGAIKHIGNIHKYIREEDVPENTIFVIITDGMENASHKYTSSKVKKMVKSKEKEGWEFIYLAANIDAVKTGAVMGIREDRAVNYKASGKGTEHLYEAVGNAIGSLRCASRLDESCFEQLEQDARS
ncbi:MAG: VWA domain-containing protein [Clostridiales bacterium]|nr:VWA domain-containing protein [Clostridiales bacterium]